MIANSRSCFGVITFLIISGVVAISLAQDIPLQTDEQGKDGEPFKVLFTGYSIKWEPNQSTTIETREELNRLVRELEASEFVDRLPELLPEMGRPDFNPVVDFDRYVVVVVVGQPHETLCRKTNILGFTRRPGNNLQIDLEESDIAECKKIGAPAFENQITLVQIKRPVVGISIASEEKKR